MRWTTACAPARCATSGSAISPRGRSLKSLWISDKKNLARFESPQMYYSLASRDIEREIVPLREGPESRDPAVERRWPAVSSPGKYSRENEKPDGARRATLDFPPVERERLWRVLDVLRPSPRHRSCRWRRWHSAWLLAQPHVTSVIIGAKNAQRAAATTSRPPDLDAEPGADPRPSAKPRCCPVSTNSGCSRGSPVDRLGQVNGHRPKGEAAMAAKDAGLHDWPVIPYQAVIPAAVIVIDSFTTRFSTSSIQAAPDDRAGSAGAQERRRPPSSDGYWSACGACNLRRFEFSAGDWMYLEASISAPRVSRPSSSTTKTRWWSKPSAPAECFPPPGGLVSNRIPLTGGPRPARP